MPKVMIIPNRDSSHVSNAGRMWMRIINPKSRIVPKMVVVMILMISIDIDFIKYKGGVIILTGGIVPISNGKGEWWRVYTPLTPI